MIISPSDLSRCSGKVVVLDTETTGLNWWKDDLIGVGVYCPEITLEGYIPTLDPVAREEVKAAVASLSPDTTILNHNLKFDLHFLDLDPAPYDIHDTTEMIHLLDSRYKKALAVAEKTFLGTDSKRAHVTEAPKRTPIHKWPMNVVADYCINDCRVTHQLAQTLWPRIEEEWLDKLYAKDMEYLKLLWKIERRGILIDPAFINDARIQLQGHIRDLEGELHDSVGYSFNWRSHKQLSKALYEDMGISKPINPFINKEGVDISRVAQRGDSGFYNSSMTSTFILMEKAKHPLGELVSSLREASKLKTTLEGWLKLMDDEQVIHTSFNLTGTRTGRLSSSKPNIQNLPSFVRTRFTQGVYSGGVERTEEYNLRNAFTARPGYTFVAVDYRQMEMRAFGILSGDPFMLKSLAAGRDIHADIAEAVWGTRDKVHREWSKTVSFGLIYGMATGSLQFKLDMSRAKAQQITDQYWQRFPQIKPWLYGTSDKIKVDGHVRYWSGRLWKEENEMFHYKGANAQIQGGCADVLSVAALRVDRWLEEEELDAYIVSLVHDEIILEVADELVPYVAENVRRIMEVEDLFNIKWLTDAKVGKTFGDMAKLEDSSEY